MSGKFQSLVNWHGPRLCRSHHQGRLIRAIFMPLLSMILSQHLFLHPFTVTSWSMSTPLIDIMIGAVGDRRAELKHLAGVARTELNDGLLEHQSRVPRWRRRLSRLCAFGPRLLNKLHDLLRLQVETPASEYIAYLVHLSSPALGCRTAPGSAARRILRSRQRRRRISS